MLENLHGPKKIFAGIGVAFLGLIVTAALALLYGFIVMWLWNWLMPVIFNLGTITFWQAWGIVLLAHILFKGTPGKGHGPKGPVGHIKSEISNEIGNEIKKEFRKERDKECGREWKNEFRRKMQEHTEEQSPSDEPESGAPENEETES